MFLDAGTAYEDLSIADLIPSSNHPLPYIQDISGCKDRFTITSCKVPPPAMVVSPNVDMPDEDSSEMDVSEPESSDFDESAVQLSPSSENIDVEQPTQLDDHGVVPSVLTEDADAQQLPQMPNQSSQSTFDTLSTTEGMSTDIASSINGTLASPALPPQLSSNAINAFGVWFQPPQNTATIVWDDDDSGTDDELFIPPTAQAHMAFANAIRPNRAYCEVTTAFTLARQVCNCHLVTWLISNQEIQPQITSPLLIVTKEDVYLYQRPLDYVGDHSDPIVTIRRPLHPSQQENLFPFIPGSHDRHCYATQIPELGVFIIASPNGRAGVFSLVKTAQKIQSRPLYSLHLEYVLPFANGDENRVWDVEGARLVGVAAGPVQGMMDRSNESSDEEEEVAKDNQELGPRRWRVMMYYTDHTVLAFELGKRRLNQTPEVGELVKVSHKT
jgi:hypothetical protein